MANTNSLISAAAAGGLTAVIALLTGFPAASADELADLRANQELLQRRIDQLAQAAPLPGTTGRGRRAALGLPGGADRSELRRQFPALVSDPRYRYLDPPRRLCRPHRALLSARRQQR